MARSVPRLRICERCVVLCPSEERTCRRCATQTSFADVVLYSAPARCEGLHLGPRYELTRLLGRGGMGVVFEAKDRPFLGRGVAIKLLAGRRLPEADDRQRFAREALVWGQLEHPNIARLLDFQHLQLDPTPGLLFLVMELLDGGTLTQRMDERHAKIPWEEAARIGRGLARALSYAHARGIVHRDIKPDNIFLHRLGGEDIVKVLDFGLAKFVVQLEESVFETRADGMVALTVPYTAPERLTESGRDTEKVDIFSAGVVLFELLSGGHHPFASGHSQRDLKLQLRLSRQGPPPLPDTVPPPLAKLVQEMLSFNPTQRPDARDAQRRLHELLPEGGAGLRAEVEILRQQLAVAQARTAEAQRIAAAEQQRVGLLQRETAIAQQQRHDLQTQLSAAQAHALAAEAKAEEERGRAREARARLEQIKELVALDRDRATGVHRQPSATPERWKVAAGLAALVLLMALSGAWGLRQLAGALDTEGSETQGAASEKAHDMRTPEEETTPELAQGSTEAPTVEEDAVMRAGPEEPERVPEEPAPTTAAPHSARGDAATRTASTQTAPAPATQAPRLLATNSPVDPAPSTEAPDPSPYGTLTLQGGVLRGLRRGSCEMTADNLLQGEVQERTLYQGSWCAMIKKDGVNDYAHQLVTIEAGTTTVVACDWRGCEVR